MWHPSCTKAAAQEAAVLTESFPDPIFSATLATPALSMSSTVLRKVVKASRELNFRLALVFKC